MKTFLIIISIAIVLLAGNESQAKPKEATILVQAQGKVIKLNTGDIRYLIRSCDNIPMFKALNSMRVIKSCDTADLIMALMSAKQKSHEN